MAVSKQKKNDVKRKIYIHTHIKYIQEYVCLLAVGRQ